MNKDNTLDRKELIIASWASREYILFRSEEDFLLVNQHWLAGICILCVSNLVCSTLHSFFSPCKQRAWARSLGQLLERARPQLLAHSYWLCRPINKLIKRRAKQEGCVGAKRGSFKKCWYGVSISRIREGKLSLVLPFPYETITPSFLKMTLIFQTLMGNFETIQRGSFEIWIL